jgi:hypothetical protein
MSTQARRDHIDRYAESLWEPSQSYFDIPNRVPSVGPVNFTSHLKHVIKGLAAEAMVRGYTRAVDFVLSDEPVDDYLGALWSRCPDAAAQGISCYCGNVGTAHVLHTHPVVTSTKAKAETRRQRRRRIREAAAAAAAADASDDCVDKKD